MKIKIEGLHCRDNAKEAINLICSLLNWKVGRYFFPGDNWHVEVDGKNEKKAALKFKFEPGADWFNVGVDLCGRKIAWCVYDKTRGFRSSGDIQLNDVNDDGLNMVLKDYLSDIKIELEHGAIHVSKEFIIADE